MLKVTHIHDQLFDSLPIEKTCFSHIIVPLFVLF